MLALKKKFKRKILPGDIGTYIGFILITMMFLGPILWVLSLSLKEVREVLMYPPKLIPSVLAWQNYAKVFESRIPMYLINSFKISLLSIIGVMLIAIPAAYAFSRGRFKGKNQLLLALLSLQMISKVIIVIPVYRYYGKLNLLNTHTGVIFVYIATILPMVTWILKGFFDTIPIDLEEASIIDGCTRRQTLFRIVLPLSGPGFFSATIFAFILSWSEFIIPFILLSEDSLYPASVGMLIFQTISLGITTHYLAAGAIVMIIPPIIVFILFQKYIIGGLTAGAVKG